MSLAPQISNSYFEKIDKIRARSFTFYLFHCAEFNKYWGVKDLSPHRKFRGSVVIKPTLRPFYQRAWPTDLPSQCQVCGTEFRFGWNIKVGPNRFGRFLKNAAVYSFLPCLVAPFVIVSLFPDSFQWMGAREGWALFFGAIFFPPLLLLLLSLFMPITRHVHCKKCGWNRDYRR